MPATFHAETSVGQLVREHPRWARVLEEFGVDYCCAGKRPFSEACEIAGVPEEMVLRKLDSCEESRGGGAKPDWNAISLSALADHIVERHHRYLREELPRLNAMLERVAEAHGHKHPELLTLRRVFRSLHLELRTHMEKEEQVLFPIVRRLEEAKEANASAPAFHCGSVNNPIRMMEHEHDDAGEALRRIRELTNQFTPPSDACETYRILLLELAELEADLHEHIHKENNILFPEASKLEESLVD